MSVRWTVILLILATIAAIFAFGGIVESIAQVAKILFYIFLVASFFPILLDRR